MCTACCGDTVRVLNSLISNVMDSDCTLYTGNSASRRTVLRVKDADFPIGPQQADELISTINQVAHPIWVKRYTFASAGTLPAETATVFLDELGVTILATAFDIHDCAGSYYFGDPMVRSDSCEK